MVVYIPGELIAKEESETTSGTSFSSQVECLAPSIYVRPLLRVLVRVIGELWGKAHLRRRRREEKQRKTKENKMNRKGKWDLAIQEV
jgi:hypothetical protein